MNGMRFVQLMQDFRLIAYTYVFSIPTGKQVHKVHRVHFLLYARAWCARGAINGKRCIKCIECILQPMQRGLPQTPLVRGKDAQKHSSHNWFVWGLYEAIDLHINSRVPSCTSPMRVGNSRFISRAWLLGIGN